MERDETVFEVGDRVEMCNSGICDGGKPGNGAQGTVLCVRHGYLGVRWDEKMPGFHNLGNLCEDGYGWWVLPQSCELAEGEATEISVQSADALFSMLGL